MTKKRPKCRTLLELIFKESAYDKNDVVARARRTVGEVLNGCKFLLSNNMGTSNCNSRNNSNTRAVHETEKARQNKGFDDSRQEEGILHPQYCKCKGIVM